MSKMTYKEAYVEALDVTHMIYNLYTELTMYKIKGTLSLEKNADKINNLIDLLNDVLDKEENVYNKINGSFDVSELGEFMDYIEEVGGIRPVSIDFEKLPYANSWLIPRRIVNRVNDLFRHNPENAKVGVPNECGELVLLNDISDEESKVVKQETGISLEQFRKEYIQTIMLEDAFIKDHTLFFLAELEDWLNKKTPVNVEQAKFYQEMVTAQMMIMFTDFVDERLMLSKRFEFSDTAVCMAPFVGDTLRYIASRKDIIKSSSTIHELKYLMEDFITVEEMDVSDSRSSVAKLNKMYFEAGLKTLTEKEFNDVLATYSNLLNTISESNNMYYSEDGVRIVRAILNRVSKANFNFDITKDSGKKDKGNNIRPGSGVKAMLKNKFSKA